ncbi:hypothetical protein M431DRAFT_519719 [Trichoderma harzianum CBS 226.95]|uniref:Uncharacterized protein n=1 Tax=Trichoderma harzianum CBS 226.95 TaxID=983964 RepID=A0A2T4AGI0_TRIHA|nr:hypothetical protein M431DRAFT_519719 [Trichoderma harzianum CBS 226.95]PTB56177.1 hypothetical protein M431DRAFT_519719 [Trichoderma harzianum CBS 226.95]
MKALAIQLSNPNDGSATSHPHRPTTRIGTRHQVPSKAQAQAARGSATRYPSPNTWGC